MEHRASDLKVGSIIEIPLNLSPEKMDVPTQIKISRVTKYYLWFDHNMFQRMGINTFQNFMDYHNYKIISI